MLDNGSDGAAVSSAGRAIVLGCAHGGLAIARTLVRGAIDVLVLTFEPDQPGLSSRFVREWRLCPHPADEVAFIDYLMTYRDEWRGALVYSTTDYFATAVARNADRLNPYFHLDVAEWDRSRTFLEKNRTYELAAQIGVPHPTVFGPTSMSDLDERIDDLELPVMIKPVHSHRFVEHYGVKLMLNYSTGELRENFASVLASGDEVVISEFIPGNDHRTLETAQLYIDRNGDLAGRFCCVKLRQTPPMFGVIRVGQSIAPTDELLDPALALIRAANYRGFASVEFKRDPRDNRLKLIEVNCRPLRMTQFAISCGVDFPRVAFDDMVRGRVAPVGDYRVGLYYVDVVPDIADFIRYDDDRNVRRFLEPYRPGAVCHPYLALGDPAPFVRDVSMRARRFVQKSLR